MLQFKTIQNISLIDFEKLINEFLKDNLLIRIWFYKKEKTYDVIIMYKIKDKKGKEKK